MTRSDLFLEVNKHDPDNLVRAMHKKIEAVYSILFVLEKDNHFKELAALIREALET